MAAMIRSISGVVALIQTCSDAALCIVPSPTLSRNSSLFIPSNVAVCEPPSYITHRGPSSNSANMIVPRLAEAGFHFHTFEVTASYLKSSNKYRRITGGFNGTVFDLNRDLVSYGTVKPHPCRAEAKTTLPAQRSDAHALPRASLSSERPLSDATKFAAHAALRLLLSSRIRTYASLGSSRSCVQSRSTLLITKTGTSRWRNTSQIRECVRAQRPSTASVTTMGASHSRRGATSPRRSQRGRASRSGARPCPAAPAPAASRGAACACRSPMAKPCMVMPRRCSSTSLRGAETETEAGGRTLRGGIRRGEYRAAPLIAQGEGCSSLVPIGDYLRVAFLSKKLV